MPKNTTKRRRGCDIPGCRARKTYSRRGTHRLCAHHTGEHKRHTLRRLEVDHWLEEQGVVVIQVRDLGAALEARHLGGRIIHTLTDVVRRIDFRNRHSGELGFHASRAAHLARRALGLGEVTP